MNTFFVHHRSPHHAKKSGYDRLLDYYPNAKGIERIPKFSYKLSRFIAALSSQKAGLYNTDSVYKELELYKKLKAHKQSLNIIHYLNAERDIRYVLKYYKNSKNIRFCGTFHKPPHILDWRVSNPKYVKHLDGAITVGENQVEYIKEHFGISKVAYIPHGVDVDFFTPKLEQRKQGRLLFVGQHLRDFDALNYCVTKIAEQIKGLSVHVVLHPSYKNKVKFHSCIKVFSNLNDEALRQQYHEASLLFLPMLNSTACNSILEAIACGLPVITNNVGGNERYLKYTESVLTPVEKYDNMIDNTITLLRNTSNIEHLSILARARALRYDWSSVVQEIQKFHETLI